MPRLPDKCRLSCNLWERGPVRAMYTDVRLTWDQFVNSCGNASEKQRVSDQLVVCRVKMSFSAALVQSILFVAS